MGVKGLYSILTNEPSRFGNHWCVGDDYHSIATNDDDDDDDDDCGDTTNDHNHTVPQPNVDIYIDGPALHHHLIATATRLLSHRSYRTNDNGSGEEKTFVCADLPAAAVETLVSYRRVRSGTMMVTDTGTVSPSLLYELTIAFLSEFENVGKMKGGAAADDDGAKKTSITSVHIVFDGVPSVHKLKTQVERLEESCRTADRIARRFVGAKAGGSGNGGRNSDVLPHLWGEDAMAEAMHDLIAKQQQQQQQQGMTAQHDGVTIVNKENEGVVADNDRYRPVTKYHIHWAKEEAEGYIAHQLIPKYHQRQEQQQQPKTNRSIVLSNDTDFLLFSNVPGFVPFHSLQFMYTSVDTGCNSDDTGRRCTAVRGYEYRRDRFLAAFIPLLLHHSLDSTNGDTSKNDGSGDKRADDEYEHTNTILSTTNNITGINTEEVMTTIAALAGCDYTLPHHNQRHIDVARGLIVRSNLGGLKKKDRNRPTSRGTLVAVLRFVSYFVSRMVEEGRKKVRRSDNVGLDNDWKRNMVRAIVELREDCGDRQSGGGRVGRSGGKGRKWNNNDENSKVVAGLNPSTPVSMLTIAVDMIRDIYCSQKEEVANKNSQCEEDTFRDSLVGSYGRPCSGESKSLRILPSLLIPDLRRIFLQGILFCRPIIETSGINSCERNKIVTAKKLKGHKSKDGSTMATDGGSTWMEENFVRCRQRLYNLIRTNAMTNNHTNSVSNNRSVEVDLHLSSSYSCLGKEESVLEYCRSGTKHTVGYVQSRVEISALSQLPSMDNFLSPENRPLSPSSSIYMILKSFFKISDHMQNNCMGGASSLSSVSEFVKDIESNIPVLNHFTFIASLLLTNKQDAILFFLIAYAPPLSSSSSARIQLNDFQGEREPKLNRYQSEYLRFMGRIQIALYHVKLMRSAIVCTSCCCNRTVEKNIAIFPSFSAHSMFHNDQITCVVWESLMSCMDVGTGNRAKLSLSKSEISELNEFTLITLVVDDTVRRIDDGLQPTNENGRSNIGNSENHHTRKLEVVEWKDTIRKAWKIWSRYRHASCTYT